MVGVQAPEKSIAKCWAGMRVFDRGKASRRIEEKKSERKDKKKITKASRSAEKSESKTDPSLSLKTHRSSAPTV